MDEDGDQITVRSDEEMANMLSFVSHQIVLILNYLMKLI